ncbi:inositol monophosphatase family protein [Streptomyces sp. NPDC004980]
MTNSRTGSYRSDADVATAAALAGADVVRGMYGRRLARIDKGAGDFATTADVAAEEAILGVIRAARPDDAVLGEEGGRSGSADAARRWLVDPLCGTLNYAVGNMLVAVNVALLHEGALHDGALHDGALHDGAAAVAAVADPFSREVFLTDGENAWVRCDGADARLAPTPATRLVDVNLDPPFPNAPEFRAVDLLARPSFVERFRPRVVSTTLALAWVAAGRRAAYVTDGGDLSGSVHFAAGIALCRAAGCVITGIDGDPVGGTGRGLVVAADDETHRLLMSMIRGQNQLRPAAVPAPPAPPQRGRPSPAIRSSTSRRGS